MRTLASGRRLSNRETIYNSIVGSTKEIIMRHFIRQAVLIPAICAAWALAQSKPAASGHWKGSIDVPGQGALGIEVDLAQDEKGGWTGEIDIPTQGLKDWPLSGISVKASDVAFAMKGVPGDPAFTARLAEDGKSMSGALSQGGGTVSFRLERTGDATISAPPKSTPIGKELEGAWEGTLEAAGTSLRLAVKLANSSDGKATGSVDSLDQGAKDIPITTITQAGANLKLELRQIGAAYDARLSDDKSELAGEWSQGGAKFPLRLKKKE